MNQNQIVITSRFHSIKYKENISMVVTHSVTR